MSISHIDHIAIAVNSISEARLFYEEILGLKIYAIEDLPQRGIKTAFIKIGQTKIELIAPLHENSEISKFLAKNGQGLHHIAMATNNIKDEEDRLKKAGIKPIYEKAELGAHNTKVNFIHPKSTSGVLIELVEKND